MPKTKKMQEEQVWLNESATAKRIGISTPTLKRWRNKNEGPAYYKIGGSVRYKPEDVQSYLDGRRVEPSESLK